MNSETAAPRKTSFMPLAGYAVIVTGLVAFYLYIVATVGAQGPEAVASMIPGGMLDFLDAIVFLVIGLVGAFIVLKTDASPGWALSIGTLGAFIVLTANQDMLIRYLTFGAVLFSIGMYGMVVSRNAVRVLMSIELMLNAVNLNMVAFARYVDPEHVTGQIFAIFILTVAAAEAAVGLAIVLAIYRNMATVDMDRFNLLKW